MTKGIKKTSILNKHCSKWRLIVTEIELPSVDDVSFTEERI